MAILPTSFRRSALTSLLDFASEREKEASVIGNIMGQIARPALQEQGAVLDNAVVLGEAPEPQPLQTWSGAAPVVQAQQTIDPASITDPLFRNMVRRESGFRTDAVSPKGALGPAQVLPSTAMDPGFGIPSIFDLADEQGVLYGDRTEAEARRLLMTEPDLSLSMGQAYKDGMAAHFGGDPRLTVRAYNAGPGAVEAYGGNPPFAETQAYENAVLGGNLTRSDMGGAGYGQMPQSVEGILGSLYPEQDQRKARRQDILMALSQGLSAISQGRPIDMSAIAAQRDQRERQAVLDMRERERARAAASLVYSQTGDRDMAAGIATGAIQYGDVVNERERQRIEREADLARVRQDQQNGRLASMFETMWPDLGLPEAAKEEVLAGIRAGDDPNTFLTLNEQAKLADASRKAEEQAAATAAARDVAIEAFTTSADPVEQYAGRLLTLSPDMNVDDALTRAQEKLKVNATEGYTLSEGQTRFGADNQPVASVPAASGADTTYEFQARIAQRMKALGEDEATATRAVLNEAAQQGVVLTLGPDGKLQSATIGGTAPAAGTPAAGGAVSELGATAPGTATVQGPDGLVNVPVPGAIAPQQAAVDLQAAQQDLQQRIAEAPTALEKAQLEVEKLRLDMQIATANQSLDVQTKQAQIKNLEAEAAKKQAEVDALQKDEKLQTSAEYNNATRQFSVFERAATDTMKRAQDAWTTGTLGRTVTAVLPESFGTERTSFLEGVKQMGSQAMLTALAEAKAAGVTLTPVSNLDVSALGASQSRLSQPELLTGEDLLAETVFQYNYAKDALYGPKNLERVDDFGFPYQVGENTLGLTEDTFARHWQEIPPEIAQAWKNGEIAALPTDDPTYAEAANSINEMAKNWELYQGPLDRAQVGVVDEPAAETEANLPPAPEGMTAEEWAGTWAELSPAAKEAYRKKVEGQ